MSESSADLNIEVIVEDGVTSSKPFILNPQTNRSKALGRWKLLKNLCIAQRRFNSLTHHEAEFLKAFSKPPDGHVAGDDCENLRKARKELEEFIELNSERLTPKERSFLRSLVDSDKVSVEYMETTLRVLESDPLYRHVHHGDSGEEGEEEKCDKSTVTKKHHNAGFRSEVWMRCSSASFGSTKVLYDAKSLRNMSTSELGDDANSGGDAAEETLQEPKKEENTTSKPGFFESFFFSSEKEEDENDDEEAEPEEEEEEKYTILGTSIEDSDCHPHVLSPPIMEGLRSHLPFTVRQDNFWLKYSMVRDGASMRAMLNKVRSSARTVLAIETFDGDVFGAFASSPWRVHPNGYYGSCEAFLWRLPKRRFSECDTVEEQIELELELEVFDWSGKNRNVQHVSSADGDLVLGGGGPDDDPSQGGGSGLTVTSDISRGFSEPCLTFGSPFIPTFEANKDLFEIANMEVWALTPVDNMEQAEKLEFGRQFIFDHGNFAQA